MIITPRTLSLIAVLLLIAVLVAAAVTGDPFDHPLHPGVHRPK